MRFILLLLKIYPNLLRLLCLQGSLELPQLWLVVAEAEAALLLRD
jgi:hypothetical protein